MIKTILIALSVLLIIPNFIDKDILDNPPYDQKERFNPKLAKIKSIDELERYVDQCAALKNIDTNAPGYAFFLSYIVSCRFYYGYSHWKLNQNWIAAVTQKITGVGVACKVQAEEIMQNPNAACSQQVLVMMEILRRKNINYRKVGFPHHYAIEVNAGNHWYYFDPNMEPTIPMAQRIHENWKGCNDNLKKYYNQAEYGNLSYQFGNHETAALGPVNEIPAKRANMFQLFTGILSKILWCVPVAFIFVKRRKKAYMYAVKPINKSFYTEYINPSYYA